MILKIYWLKVILVEQRQMRIPKKPKNQVWKSETEITLNPSIKTLTQQITIHEREVEKYSQTQIYLPVAKSLLPWWSAKFLLAFQ
jgi:hypothetical protein